MADVMTTTDMLDRLEAATNAHDLDALVDCFAANYRNETPVHPARGFDGREQVRANWAQIFAGVPDIHARVLNRTVGEEERVWSEWEMSGTRQDGQPHLMRGVVIFTVHDERATAARFYLEPVDFGVGDVNAAVRTTLGEQS